MYAHTENDKNERKQKTENTEKANKNPENQRRNSHKFVKLWHIRVGLAAL